MKVRIVNFIILISFIFTGTTYSSSNISDSLRLNLMANEPHGPHGPRTGKGKKLSRILAILTKHRDSNTQVQMKPGLKQKFDAQLVTPFAKKPKIYNDSKVGILSLPLIFIPSLPMNPNNINIDDSGQKKVTTEEVYNLIDRTTDKYVTWPVSFHPENQQDGDLGSGVNGRLVNLLQDHLGYPEASIPEIVKGFEKLFEDIEFDNFRNRLQTKDAEELKEAIKDLMFSVKLNGYLNPYFPKDLTKLLVNALNIRNEDIFKLIDESDIFIGYKEQMKTMLVSCTAASQLNYILLNLADIEVKSASAPNHIFNFIPLKENKYLLVDFMEGIIDEIDIFKNYQREGSLLVLKEDKLLDLVQIQRKLLYGPKIDALSQGEILNILYSYILEGDVATHSIIDNIATAYYDLGKVIGTMELFKKSIALSSKSPNDVAYFGLGALYNSLSKYNEALDLLNKAIEINPRSGAAYFQQGISYYNLKNYYKAIESFNKSIELNPFLTEAYLKLAMTYYELGKYAEASKTYGSIGVIFSRLGEYEKTLEVLKEAISLDPQNIEAYDYIINTYILLDKYDEASKLRDKIRIVNPNVEKYIHLGNIYFTLGDYNYAVETFKKATELNGNDAEAYRGLGCSYGKLKKYDDAVETFKKAIKLNPENIKAYRDLGAIYFYIKKHKDAIGVLEKAIDLDPYNYELYRTLGFAYFESGQYTEAIGAFEGEIEQLSPADRTYLAECYEMLAEANIKLKNYTKTAEAYDNLGFIYFSAGEYQDAANILEEAVRFDPNYVNAYSNLGMAYFALGRYGDANDIAERAIELDPANSNAHAIFGFSCIALNKYNEGLKALKEAVKIDPKNIQAYNNLGTIYAVLGKYEDAIEALEKAINLDLNNTKAYINLGNIYIMLDKYDIAFELLTKAIRLDSENSEAYNSLGKLYYRLNEKGEAIKMLKEAIRLNPNYPDAHSCLGIIWFELGIYDDAIESLEKAISLNPNIGYETYFNLGEAYFELGRYTEALEPYKEAVRINPEDPYNLESLGLTYAALGEYADAAKSCEEAIKKGLNTADIYLSLGCDYHLSGKYSEAIKPFKQALELEPDWAPAHLFLGMAYYRLGNHGEAVKSFRKAVGLDPGLFDRVPEELKKEVRSDKDGSFNLEKESPYLKTLSLMQTNI